MAPLGVALIGGGLFAKQAHMVRNPSSIQLRMHQMLNSSVSPACHRQDQQP